MRRISNKSKIEVWSGEYINNSSTKPRQPEDSPDKVNIIQIEPGSTNGDYMVEVEPKEEFAAPTGEYKYTDADMNAQYDKGKDRGIFMCIEKIRDELNNPNTAWDSSQMKAFRDFIKELNKLQD